MEVSSSFVDAIYYLSLDLVRKTYIEVAGVAWKPSKKHTAMCRAQWCPFGFFKDAMTKKDNWIYQELHQAGVL